MTIDYIDYNEGGGHYNCWIIKKDKKCNGIFENHIFIKGRYHHTTGICPKKYRSKCINYNPNGVPIIEIVGYGKKQ